MASKPKITIVPVECVRFKEIAIAGGEGGDEFLYGLTHDGVVYESIWSSGKARRIWRKMSMEVE